MKIHICFITAMVWMFASTVLAQEESNRCGLWIDLYAGEPISFEDMMEDLAQVDIIYTGETHRLDRHHQLQLQIAETLHQKGKKILLGLEQIEHPHQPAVDLYNQGEIDFEEMAKRIEWQKQWENFRDYQPLVESIHSSGGRIVALNAPLPVIRKIGREGIFALTPEERKQIPEDLQLEDPLYEKWLNQVLMVHMPLSPEKLKPVFHAQVCRDEAMAESMAKSRNTVENPQEWTSVIVCGGGHITYGLGIPARLKRRLPNFRERIILMSESGDTVLSEAEKAMSRDIEITHEHLRFLQVPIGDYLHAVEQKGENDSE